MSLRLLYLIMIRVFDLWVPESSSSQCEQAVFVDCATDARLSSYAVLLKIGWFG